MTKKTDNKFPEEVWALLEAVCEDRLTGAQKERLEELVLSDRHVRRLYVDYITLHGNLHWDAALPAGSDAVSIADSNPEFRAVPESTQGEPSSFTRSPWFGWVLTGIAACLLITFGALAQRAWLNGDGNGGTNIVDRKTTDPVQPNGKTTSRKVAVKSNGGRRKPIGSHEPHNKVAHKPPKKKDDTKVVENRVPPAKIPPGGSSLDKVVAFVNARLEENWQLEGVQASDLADDGKWVRRVYLDLIGRIPTVAEVDRFVKDESEHKRRKLIDDLLDDPRYVRHWSTVWSNLLVGRKPSRNVNRPALEKFLRDSLHRNRPWKEIVIDLVAAEGSTDSNGAANFLVAHLNNQAVPATAVTARLFLGLQVQCTQCHDHPFNNWKQNQFWELNSFFKQTAVARKKTKPGKRSKTELVNKPVGGYTYYQQRNFVIRVAVPRYGATKVPLDANINRRKELARLMFEDEDKQVARALVNRLWARFFGYGFTRPIDDMGPHNPPSHPELLDRLSEEFIASGYDLKRLIRFIVNSKAYQLTSRFNETNDVDDPDKGHMPLFSRMYVKSMSVEQLYDSLLVATKADAVGSKEWDDVLKRRRRWLQQFIRSYNTEENDESSTFDGTIPQALAMMNSELTQNALSNARGTFFHKVASSKSNESTKVRNLAIAALSREPTAKEAAAFRKLFRRQLPRGVTRRQLQTQVLQDIFWAYLNSSEFILIH